MKLLKILVSLCALAFSDGITRLALPSGDKGFSITCSNANSVNGCYEIAGNLCTDGYKIISDNTQNGQVSGSNSSADISGSRSATAVGTAPGVFSAISSGGLFGGAHSNSFAASTSERGILIQCKNDSVMYMKWEKNQAEAAEEESLERDRRYKAWQEEKDKQSEFFWITGCGGAILIGIVLLIASGN